MITKEKYKGISLVSLVITIIVIILLTATVIIMLSGENGIISRAREAADRHNLAIAREKIITEMCNIKLKATENGQEILQYLYDETYGTIRRQELENKGIFISLALPEEKELVCTIGEYSATTNIYGDVTNIIKTSGIQETIVPGPNIPYSTTAFENSINMDSLIDWPLEGNAEQGKTHTKTEWIQIFNTAEQAGNLQMNSYRDVETDYLYITEIAKTGYARIRIICNNKDQTLTSLIPISYDYEICTPNGTDTYTAFNTSRPMYGAEDGDFEYIFIRIDENILNQGYICVLPRAQQLPDTSLNDLGQTHQALDISILYDV